MTCGTGTILFVPAGSDVSVCADGSAPLTMWAAAVNSTFLQLSQAMQEAAAAAAAATMADISIVSSKVEVPVTSAAIYCAQV